MSTPGDTFPRVEALPGYPCKRPFDTWHLIVHRSPGDVIIVESPTLLDGMRVARRVAGAERVSVEMH